MARTSFGAVTGSNQEIVAAPGAGLALRIIRLVFTVDAADTVSFSDGDAAAGTRIFYGKYTGAGGAILESPGDNTGVRPWAILTANTALKATAAAANLHGVVEYETVSA